MGRAVSPAGVKRAEAFEEINRSQFSGLMRGLIGSRKIEDTSRVVAWLNQQGVDGAAMLFGRSAAFKHGICAVQIEIGGMNNSPPPPLVEFAQLAAQFCTWCESGALGIAPERAISQWFAQLYVGGLQLSEVEAESSAPETIAPDTSQAEAAISHLRGYYYREIFDPDPKLDEEGCVGDIGDDLLDVYKDIKRGLELYRQGFPLAAEWEWAFNFRIHWGRHAAATLLALHGLVHSRE